MKLFQLILKLLFLFPISFIICLIIAMFGQYVKNTFPDFLPPGLSSAFSLNDGIFDIVKSVWIYSKNIIFVTYFLLSYPYWIILWFSIKFTHTKEHDE